MNKNYYIFLNKNTKINHIKENSLLYPTAYLRSIKKKKPQFNIDGYNYNQIINKNDFTLPSKRGLQIINNNDKKKNNKNKKINILINIFFKKKIVNTSTWLKFNQTNKKKQKIHTTNKLLESILANTADSTFLKKKKYINNGTNYSIKDFNDVTHFGIKKYTKKHSHTIKKNLYPLLNGLKKKISIFFVIKKNYKYKYIQKYLKQKNILKNIFKIGRTNKSIVFKSKFALKAFLKKQQKRHLRHKYIKK